MYIYIEVLSDGQKQRCCTWVICDCSW